MDEELKMKMYVGAQELLEEMKEDGEQEDIYNAYHDGFIMGWEALHEHIREISKEYTGEYLKKRIDKMARIKKIMEE